jgi:hypothetical protein
LLERGELNTAVDTLKKSSIRIWEVERALYNRGMNSLKVMSFTRYLEERLFLECQKED